MNKNNLEIFRNYHTQIQRIFVYYCSFGDKQEYCLLKIQNYQRLLADLQLPNHQTLVPQLDLIFYKHACSTCLDFNRFMNTLQPIASLVFADDNEQKGLQKLLCIHIQSLYDTILTETEFGHTLNFISAKQLVESSFVFLRKFQQSLFIVYCNYFSKEGKQGIEEQFKMFSKLSRELNFTPKIISKSISYLIFLFLRQKESKSVFHNLFTKSLGKIPKQYKFDFICFLQYLIILSHIKADSDEQDVYKIYRLFQSIEVSSGCQNLYKKIKFKHFYLSSKQLEQCSVIKKVQIQVTPQKSTIKYIQNNNNQSPIKNKLGDYHDSLKTKFTKLCLKTYVETNFYLSFALCKKLIQKICPSLTGICIDLMIKAAGRLNFQNFIHLLDAAAKKTGMNSETIYEQVLLYGTDKYSINLIIQNVRLSKKEQSICNEVLNLLQSYLKWMFQYYYDSNRVFNLQTYLKMLQETTIIPFVMETSQAVDIYKYVAKNQENMTFQEFRESFKITIVSVHFAYQLQAAQRLIYMLQKLCQSKKGESLMKKNMLLIKEHPLYRLRLAYSDIYKSIEQKMKNYNDQALKHEVIK